MAHCLALYAFPQILQQRTRLFGDIYVQNTSRIVTGLFHGSITTEYSRFSASCQSALFLPKQAFLLGISTRVVCRNASPNHSVGPYLVSLSASQCKDRLFPKIRNCHSNICSAILNGATMLAVVR